MFSYQTYQLSKIPINKITKIDLMEKTRTELLFNKKNRIQEMNTYSLDTKELQEHSKFSWNENQIIDHIYSSGDFSERATLLKTDSGNVLKYQYSNKMVKYRKLDPARLEFNHNKYLTDNYYNIIGIEETDSIGQKVIWDLDPYGNAIKSTTYLKDSTVRTDLFTLAKGEIIQVEDANFKKIESYDKSGRLIEFQFFVKHLGDVEFKKTAHRKWIYE